MRRWWESTATLWLSPHPESTLTSQWIDHETGNWISRLLSSVYMAKGAVQRVEKDDISNRTIKWLRTMASWAFFRLWPLLNSVDPILKSRQTISRLTTIIFSKCANVRYDRVCQEKRTHWGIITQVSLLPVAGAAHTIPTHIIRCGQLARWWHIEPSLNPHGTSIRQRWKLVSQHRPHKCQGRGYVR
jgi:hypothetical protein